MGEIALQLKILIKILWIIMDLKEQLEEVPIFLCWIKESQIIIFLLYLAIIIIKKY